MSLFEQFTELLRQVEEELSLSLKDFEPEDFFVLEGEMEEIMFSDDEVLEKLRECGAVDSIEKDIQASVVIVRLVDGCIGTFGI
ncbi:hypothetical protein [Sporanaerobium hydrogeniformans]|uniref:hypothetical protein n=1 Tax=Sporanaerobium hydrogeniformans TaxID=3072179 RepID=UPI00117B19CC|nr:hypothetical protein [Sporanaerobium hydrogeniformans]